MIALDDKEARAVSIQTRVDTTQRVYAEALREKWSAGFELTKDEAIIKFILDNEEEVVGDGK